MVSLLEFLLMILAGLAFYGLTWRNRLIRDPVTGRTKAPWLTAEAAALVDKLHLREGKLPELPRQPASRMPLAIASVWSAARAGIGLSSAAASWAAGSSLAPVC